MTEPWQGAPPPPAPKITPAGWVRIALRGAALGGVNFGGLALLLAVRLLERPLCGLHRPVTPTITRSVCRLSLRILRLRLHQQGAPMPDRGHDPAHRPGAIVANHGSWLDIFVLNACARIYFVAKAEVAGWAGIGWLARATGTLFIRRDRAEAASQTAALRDRLAAGHRLLFFPEGTSTDGARVLPFKPTLFQAFFDPGLPAGLRVQPVSVAYHAPRGADPAFYGWWGEMDFAAHLLKLLAHPGGGSVTVIWHAPLSVADFAGRKALAGAAEHAVRAGHAATVKAPVPPRSS
jgi:1-acyl-sn-glycerol-3-phosphate acyltransferase